MQVTEIFRSIQGESTYAGLPCTFIRLTACNLRCAWCDTEYSFYGGSKMTLEEVMRQVHGFGGRLVEITGGEPLLQEEVYPLMDRLLGEGYTVMLETSGERPIARVPREVVKIVDVKCPDSGEGDTFAMENLEHLAPHDQIKFVLAGRRDYEFARDFTRAHDLTGRAAAVIFSPVHGKVDLPEMARWMLEDGLEKVRFGSQLHKVIWGAEARGV
jgi:7-carboxy-7-deazaguanine synthase